MPFGGFFSSALWFPVLMAIALWSLYWKAKALWRSARNGQKGWFVALLLINTLGILEILYLYVLGNKAESTKINKGL
ncbi:MAG: hypothetical protein G01um101433_852 [Parcubacteria group bacterium Gr01-1014_33]|nr:MAG: hypothetical protein G01um101433_852 [Parcubacteria group bacterium Gr01-1014_33]